MATRKMKRIEKNTRVIMASSITHLQKSWKSFFDDHELNFFFRNVEFFMLILSMKN